MILLAAACDLAAAQSVPLPSPRPVPVVAVPPAPDDPAQPSSCLRRLAPALAVVTALPALNGPGECGGEDIVRLEAVVLADKTHVVISPPATLRCSFAEAIAHWVREDVAPAVRALGAPLKGVDNYASYDCRGRNRVAGAKLSEHGKANALDMRSFKLANGAVVRLTDPHVARDFREALRQRTCARFTTVLGPGSDGYHEDHVHVDLAMRRSGYRMCQWEVREPVEQPSAAAVPLPQARPAARAYAK